MVDCRWASRGGAWLVACSTATWAGGAALETGRGAGPARRRQARRTRPVAWTESGTAAAPTACAPRTAASRAAGDGAARRTMAPLCAAVGPPAASTRLASQLPELPLQLSDVRLMLGAAAARHGRGLRRMVARQKPPRRRHSYERAGVAALAAAAAMPGRLAEALSRGASGSAATQRPAAGRRERIRRRAGWWAA